MTLRPRKPVIAPDLGPHDQVRAMFVRGCPRQARVCAERLVERGDDPLATGLLADAHFALRSFDTASRLYSQWFDGNTRLDAARVLRQYITPLIQQDFGEGHRQVRRASMRAAEASRLSEPEARKAGLREAFQMDPLCGDAWTNYAPLVAEENPEQCANEWVAAVSLAGHLDVRHHIQALALLSRDSSETAAVLRLAVLRLTLDRYGERFFEELQRQDPGASIGGSASYLQYLRNTVDAARQVFPDAEQEPVPRAIGP
ncbi:hypothetical protein HPP05_29270 [Corallococcus exiguus]|uniref:hypothetical protein n=1 Tax=Corallococcus exiguus TaxID=83462 RepID=UPI0014949FA7|nr:hypothetical protein [Corallococcus exiguus]NPC73855.1 hypothetical protein [Corallococcus exiguus]